MGFSSPRYIWSFNDTLVHPISCYGDGFQGFYFFLFMWQQVAWSCLLGFIRNPILSSFQQVQYYNSRSPYPSFHIVLFSRRGDIGATFQMFELPVMLFLPRTRSARRMDFVENDASFSSRCCNFRRVLSMGDSWYPTRCCPGKWLRACPPKFRPNSGASFTMVELRVVSFALR